ncbi:DUF3168 domain-containing protein [Martelella mangrovi]|uniref:DUF3168 domain-containing protein n=1 Tax=Martelella mangrovi TaxID=1397477 RepID=A0ABV2IG72_9HYPH
MDASYELAFAVMNRLKADAAVSAFVAGQVFDRVPAEPKPQSPYTSLGPTDSVQDDAECIAGQEISFQVDCWSWGAGEAYGSAEVRKLAGAVRQCLHGAEFTLAENAFVMLEHRVTRIMRDPDGVTNHAAMTFSAFVETD